MMMISQYYNAISIISGDDSFTFIKARPPKPDRRRNLSLSFSPVVVGVV